MKRILTYIEVFCISVLVFTSCKESSLDVHNVEAEFEPYIQKFFTDAERYGTPISDKNVVMKFANLTDGKAGVCYMNRIPVYIEIDRDNWNNLVGPNASNEKEDLIFHEMGHGFLRRLHDNTELQNKDWKTIMCGDELPDGRGPNINYRGMRKEYYIKELFTNTSEIPQWSTYKPDFSHLQESVVLNATSSTPKNWYIVSTETIESKIDGDHYLISNKGENGVYIPLKGNSGSDSIFDVTKDFYYEANVKFTSDVVKTPSCGIGFSNKKPGSPDVNPMHYFDFTNAKYINIGENSCKFPFINIFKDAINPDGYTKLGMRKHNDTLFYYVNNEFLYHNDLTDLPVQGYNFGFIVSGNTTLTVEYATVKSTDAPK